MPPEQPSAEQDPRVYLAAERTFLAWIRTGLGLMGVGFAVARFELFLREMQTAGSAVQTTGISRGSGGALGRLGVAVNLYATVRHVVIVRELRSESWVPGRISRGAVALAVV